MAAHGVVSPVDYPRVISWGRDPIGLYPADEGTWGHCYPNHRIDTALHVGDDEYLSKAVRFFESGLSRTFIRDEQVNADGVICGSVLCSGCIVRPGESLGFFQCPFAQQAPVLCSLGCISPCQEFGHISQFEFVRKLATGNGFCTFCVKTSSDVQCSNLALDRVMLERKLSTRVWQTHQGARKKLYKIFSSQRVRTSFTFPERFYDPMFICLERFPSHLDSSLSPPFPVLVYDVDRYPHLEDSCTYTPSPRYVRPVSWSHKARYLSHQLHAALEYADFITLYQSLHVENTVGVHRVGKHQVGRTVFSPEIRDSFNLLRSPGIRVSNFPCSGVRGVCGGKGTCPVCEFRFRSADSLLKGQAQPADVNLAVRNLLSATGESDVSMANHSWPTVGSHLNSSGVNWACIGGRSMGPPVARPVPGVQELVRILSEVVQMQRGDGQRFNPGGCRSVVRDGSATNGQCDNPYLGGQPEHSATWQGLPVGTGGSQSHGGYGQRGLAGNLRDAVYGYGDSPNRDTGGHRNHRGDGFQSPESPLVLDSRGRGGFQLSSTHSPQSDYTVGDSRDRGSGSYSRASGAEARPPGIAREIASRGMFGSGEVELAQHAAGSRRFGTGVRDGDKVYNERGQWAESRCEPQWGGGSGNRKRQRDASSDSERSRFNGPSSGGPGDNSNGDGQHGGYRGGYGGDRDRHNLRREPNRWSDRGHNDVPQMRGSTGAHRDRVQGPGQHRSRSRERRRAARVPSHEQRDLHHQGPVSLALPLAVVAGARASDLDGGANVAVPGAGGLLGVAGVTAPADSLAVGSVGGNIGVDGASASGVGGVAAGGPLGGGSAVTVAGSSSMEPVLGQLSVVEALLAAESADKRYSELSVQASIELGPEQKIRLQAALASAALASDRASKALRDARASAAVAAVSGDRSVNLMSSLSESPIGYMVGGVGLCVSGGVIGANTGENSAPSMVGAPHDISLSTVAAGDSFISTPVAFSIPSGGFPAEPQCIGQRSASVISAADLTSSNVGADPLSGHNAAESSDIQEVALFCGSSARNVHVSSTTASLSNIEPVEICTGAAGLPVTDTVAGNEVIARDSALLGRASGLNGTSTGVLATSLVDECEFGGPKHRPSDAAEKCAGAETAASRSAVVPVKDTVGGNEVTVTQGALLERSSGLNGTSPGVEAASLVDHCESGGPKQRRSDSPSVLAEDVQHERSGKMRGLCKNGPVAPDCGLVKLPVAMLICVGSLLDATHRRWLFSLHSAFNGKGVHNCSIGAANERYKVDQAAISLVLDEISSTVFELSGWSQLPIVHKAMMEAHSRYRQREFPRLCLHLGEFNSSKLEELHEEVRLHDDAHRDEPRVDNMWHRVLSTTMEGGGSLEVQQDIFSSCRGAPYVPGAYRVNSNLSRVWQRTTVPLPVGDPSTAMDWEVVFVRGPECRWQGQVTITATERTVGFLRAIAQNVLTGEVLQRGAGYRFCVRERVYPRSPDVSSSSSGQVIKPDSVVRGWFQVTFLPNTVFDGSTSSKVVRPFSFVDFPTSIQEHIGSFLQGRPRYWLFSLFRSCPLDPSVVSSLVTSSRIRIVRHMVHINDWYDDAASMLRELSGVEIFALHAKGCSSSSPPYAVIQLAPFRSASLDQYIEDCRLHNLTQEVGGFQYHLPSCLHSGRRVFISQDDYGDSPETASHALWGHDVVYRVPSSDYHQHYADPTAVRLHPVLWKIVLRRVGDGIWGGAVNMHGFGESAWSLRVAGDYQCDRELFSHGGRYELEFMAPPGIPIRQSLSHGPVSKIGLGCALGMRLLYTRGVGVFDPAPVLYGELAGPFQWPVPLPGSVGTLGKRCLQSGLGGRISEANMQIIRQFDGVVGATIPGFVSVIEIGLDYAAPPVFKICQAPSVPEVVVRGGRILDVPTVDPMRSGNPVSPVAESSYYVVEDHPDGRAFLAWTPVPGNTRCYNEDRSNVSRFTDTFTRQRSRFEFISRFDDTASRQPSSRRCVRKGNSRASPPKNAVVASRSVDSRRPPSTSRRIPANALSDIQKQSKFEEQQLKKLRNAVCRIERKLEKALAEVCTFTQQLADIQLPEGDVQLLSQEARKTYKAMERKVAAKQKQIGQLDDKLASLQHGAPTSLALPARVLQFLWAPSIRRIEVLYWVPVR